MKNSKKITLPTYLTLFRLLGAPSLVPFFIVHYGSCNNFVINLSIATLFLFFGLTDFLDGFFARKYAQESQLGATLDHLADKFLTFSAFVALLAIGKISYLWVVLLIGREFFVMGLREIALEHAMSIRVSLFGKLKTVVHIALIAWIIVNPAQGQVNLLWNGIELVLLAASLIISWASALQYFAMFYAQLQK
ncbi:MAG: CDP-diacylglycerol--glycerol-3-phosphate 3-phosphatidyltransferase [Candidatus Chromulinivorax sp.]|nr:CDP-diacylglycerol--glycerol-3-phosphate 3-phosphatidyltransferase [Candidatus Chromulinivorax sp.]